MSGGVDSSVAAFLLQRQGFSVTGVTMCLGEGLNSGSRSCCSREAISDAKKVCQKLAIRHYVFDFSQELEKKVISNFLEKYRQGKTPNPCVDCNKFIKFGALLKKAKNLGFDYLATGHYAKIKKTGNGFLLKKPKDKIKDQTYFLYLIKDTDLKSILFPLADYKKSRVQEIAKKEGLPVFDKPQSQDLCFSPAKNYADFIQKRGEKSREGLIVDSLGKPLGKHRGIFNYTIGQRKKIGLSWKEPLYVLAIDAKKNKIKVGEKEKLKQKGLIASELNFFTKCFPQELKAKIRYRHKEAACLVSSLGKKVKVIFKRKQESIACGQAVVFYDKEIVLGGGTIEEVLSENN